MPGRPGRSGMQLSPGNWTEGLNSLISLGDMLSMAGFPDESREDTSPPLPPGPVPLEYMDPPAPPSP
eukprot:3558035-Karenia_brevis.AAC.1